MANSCGKKWKQWQFIFFGSKITADGDCSSETKRRVILGRRAMTNLVVVVQLPSHVHLFLPHGLQHARFHCPSHLPRFAQVCVCWIGDAIQPSHPLSPSSSFSLSQHQGLFQWVSCSHQVAKDWSFRQCIKKHKHHLADKSPYSHMYGFSSSHVWMLKLDHKEGWALKNWSFWTVALEKTSWESLGQQRDQTSQS